MQGFPDPYSGLAQGLTNGVQAGTNIMQMVYQKAQAKLDNDMKSLALDLKIGSQAHLPAQVRADSINKGFEKLSIFNKGQAYPKIQAADLDSEKTKALRDMSKIFSDETKSLPDRIKLISMRGAEAGIGVEAKELTSILGAEHTAQKNEGLITGTPAVQGLRGLSQGLPPLEQFRNEQLVREGKPIDLPKDEKAATAAETIETEKGVFQWNPKTERYDIPYGKGKGSSKEAKELAKEDKLMKKEDARIQTAIAKANLVMGKVDEALGLVGYNTTGLGGAILGKVPGTASVDLDETLDTIRANIGFNELAEMRQSSPTGGALGQVAVRELELLTSALGSLKQRQSRPQLTKNLNDIKTHYTNWKDAVDKSAAAKPSGSKDKPAAPGGGKTVTVKNPVTGEMETWDTTTEKRVK